MNAKRLYLGLLPVIVIALLSACSQSQTGSTLSFQMQHDSQAHAVLENADGTVISSMTLAPGTNDVTFTDVPDGALVTALTSEMHNGAPMKFAFTAPASLLNGRQVYVVNHFSSSGQSYGRVTASGACPAGSTTATRIYNLRSSRPGTGGLRYDSGTCDGSGNFSFTANYDDVGSSGNAQLTFVAQNGSTMTGFLHAQNVSPSQTTLSVAQADWQTSPTADASSLSFSPALVTNGSAGVDWYKYAMVDGLREPLSLQGSTTSSTVGTASLSLNQALAPVAGATAYISSLRFRRHNCPSATPCFMSAVYRDASTSTLPANLNFAIGTDTWPSLRSFTWTASASSSPVISYTSSPSFSSAKLVYADVNTADPTTGARSEWEYVSENPADMNGTITFPQLPASLQAQIPVPAASGNSADLSITDVSADAWWFNALWPNTYNEVDASTTAVTTAGLAAVPRTPGAHGPIGGSGLWMR